MGGVGLSLRKLKRYINVWLGNDTLWSDTSTCNRSWSYAVNVNAVVRGIIEVFKVLSRSKDVNSTSNILGSKPFTNERYARVFLKSTLPTCMGGDRTDGDARQCCSGMKLPRPSQLADIWAQYQLVLMEHHLRYAELQDRDDLIIGNLVNK